MAEKKGLIGRLIMGRDDRPDLTAADMPSNRWQLFGDRLTGRFGVLVKLNLLLIVFAIPAAFVYLFAFYLRIVKFNVEIPYSGNLLVGYPVVTDAAQMGTQAYISSLIGLFVLLLPAVVIFCVGLTGAFHVIKLLVWDEGVHVFSHFFKGLKSNVLSFIVIGLLVYLSVFVIIFNLTVPAFSGALQVLVTVSSFIVLILVAVMTMFLTTQTVTYKLSRLALIKNSFLFAVALLPQNLFFLLLSALPVILVVFLFGVPFLGMILFLLFILVGFCFMILLWTVYCHWAFDKFINDKVEGAVKDRGIYRDAKADRKAEDEKRKKSAATRRFVNPKKKKPTKSVDEGSGITELAPTFSRADLERLAKEKEAVKKEIDEEYEGIEDDAEEVDGVEEAGGESGADGGGDVSGAGETPDIVDKSESGGGGDAKNGEA